MRTALRKAIIFNNMDVSGANRRRLSGPTQFQLLSLRAGEDFCLMRILNRIEVYKKTAAGCWLPASRRGLLKGIFQGRRIGVVVNKELTKVRPPIGRPLCGIPRASSCRWSANCCRFRNRALARRDPAFERSGSGLAQIREKFNLEPSDAPVRPGSTWCRAKERWPAVYVEGDLQKLEFAPTTAGSPLFSAGQPSAANSGTSPAWRQ